MLKYFISLFTGLMLLFPVQVFAQAKTKVGKPLPPMAQPEKNADTIKPTKIGNFILLPAPKRTVEVTPAVSSKTISPASKPGKAAYGNPPPLQVNIRLMENKVNQLKDVVVYITLTNKGRTPYDFQFDKPYRPGVGPWYTECIIRRNGENIAKNSSRGDIKPHTFTREYLVAHKTPLLPKNWIMKGYLLKQLVVFDDQIEKTGDLPNGYYELQVSYMGVLSNTITLQVR